MTERPALSCDEITDPKERMEFLPAMAGEYFHHFEQIVFAMAANMIENYEGGLWAFHRVTNNNGAFVGGFMHPDADEEATFVSMNGSIEKMSMRHAGLCITLTALSHLSFNIYEREGMSSGDGNMVATHYHNLREWMYSGEFAELEGKPKQQMDAMQPLIRVLD